MRTSTACFGFPVAGCAPICSKVRTYTDHRKTPRDSWKSVWEQRCKGGKCDQAAADRKVVQLKQEWHLANKDQFLGGNNIDDDGQKWQNSADGEFDEALKEKLEALVLSSTLISSLYSTLWLYASLSCLRGHVGVPAASHALGMLRNASEFASIDRACALMHYSNRAATAPPTIDLQLAIARPHLPDFYLNYHPTYQ
jgi:hypothetical protein